MFPACLISNRPYEICCGQLAGLSLPLLPSRFIYLLTVPAPLERWLQARVLLALRQHYQTRRQMENLHVTLLPEFYATADNFVLPNRGEARSPAADHGEARHGACRCSWSCCGLRFTSAG